MSWITYLIIAALLVIAELLYFRIADRFNIIDKPNERSSHSSIVLRGGGIIVPFAVCVWAVFNIVQGGLTWFNVVQDSYLLFVVALLLIAGVSFVDDVRSLPDSVRLVAQFVSMALMFWQLYLMTNDVRLMSNDGGVMTNDNWLVEALHGSSVITYLSIVAIGLIVTVGATNVINFMDGINGITAGYALAVLLPLAVINDGRVMSNEVISQESLVSGQESLVNGQESLVNGQGTFIDESFLMVMALAVLVFAWFNFRPRGKARCFAGDVGSIGVGYVLLFAIGRLIVATGDVTWLILLLVYGVDGCMTILHRIKLHENLGEAHRKHAYQLMANELGLSHPLVSGIYMALQLVVSLGFIFGCPAIADALGTWNMEPGTNQLVLVHWIYLGICIIVLCTAYVLFMKKYYHLHEEWLAKRR